MSLKDFHMVFIVASILLTFGFGFWALNNNGNPPTTGLRVTAAVSFTIGIGLVLYLMYFVRKLNPKV